MLAFFAHDDGRAGVLAKRQQARGGHIGILEHREGDHAVVFARFLVVEDRGNLLQVLRPQEEVDVMKRLIREQRERLGIDDEHLFLAQFFDADVILRQQAVFSVVGAEFEERLVVESGGWHGFPELAAVSEGCNASEAIWTLVFAAEGLRSRDCRA